MHERRTSISVKDARDEAMRLRQSVAPPDDDDDDDDGGQVLNAVTVASPPHVVKVNYLAPVFLNLTPEIAK